MKDFRGKVAVITGGAAGIGRALAERFGREGVKLVLADIEGNVLETTVGELRAKGLDVIGEVTDVTKFDAVERLAEKSFSHFGAVHLLFNNAGVVISEATNVWDISLNTWKWYFDVDFYGIVHGIKAFLPRLIKQNQEAHVVNTIAHAGYLLTHPMITAYSASKAAAGSLTESLHLQLRGQNSPIKVSAFLPGPHTVPSSTYTSARNRPADLPPDPIEPAQRVATLEEMQAYMLKTIGRVRETSSVDEVAEQAFKGIVADKYWINDMSDRFERAVRLHTDQMHGRIDPTLPYDVL